MHIETVNLLDGDYELVPANTATPESASLNYTDLNQDLGQVPEEPKANSAQEGKPGAFKSYYFCIFIHVYMCCNNLFICAFKFLGVVCNRRCVFLGSNVMFTRFTSTRCMANRTSKSRVVSCYSRDYRS